ncbi:hypothetical protein [Microlunatus speluncae]|uniref:hypothetical protein n=1 Tax=Microlunatus speluncae TaxID=2594267 RepID=UPI0012666038|nr:hypothetical protein [Microlunatus speluncae]
MALSGEAGEVAARRLKLSRLERLIVAAGGLRHDPADPLGAEAKEVTIAAARAGADSAAVAVREVVAVADDGWGAVRAIAGREIERLTADLGEWFTLADEASRHLGSDPTSGGSDRRRKPSR